MWKAELEFAILENELDQLLDDRPASSSPCITHLGLKGHLLHALHFVLSFFESWVPSFEL